MEDINVLSNQLWTLLVEDIKSDTANFPHQRPLLAHYTSIEVFEKIVKNEEVWFSNPLFMSDLQEIRFGVLEGSRIFRASESIEQACNTSARYKILLDAFDHCLDEFSNKHVLDIYAFCLSKHDPEDYEDGRLSMWRGYGGNGKGVAIVFDLGKMNVVEGSPFVISRVHYKSSDERREWLNQKMHEVSEFIKKMDIPNEHLYLVAHILFERIKLAALFSKHHGFREEKEWRIVYMKERDIEKKYLPTFGHIITKRGVEPKLHFKVQPTAGLTSDDLSLNKLISKIILGPMIADVLAYESMLRMLDNLNSMELKDRIICSSIPYRQT